MVRSQAPGLLTSPGAARRRLGEAGGQRIGPELPPLLTSFALLTRQRSHSARGDGNRRKARKMKRMSVRLSLALTLLALVGFTVPALAAPDPDLGDCQELQVPAGNTVTFHAYAVGVQIYRWNGAKWAFVAPGALLFADAGHDSVVGIHFAGPTWESVSGSKAVGVVLERCTPDPTAI